MYNYTWVNHNVHTEVYSGLLYMYSAEYIGDQSINDSDFNHFMPITFRSQMIASPSRLLPCSRRISLAVFLYHSLRSVCIIIIYFSFT